MDERGTFTELWKDLAVTCKANTLVLQVFIFSDVLDDTIILDLAVDLEH